MPSFVLEFLLAKFCATDDPDEIQAGIAAVIETIQKNYVRPDESNRAQSLVQQKGKHKFIDKIHVRYVESEKRHWAEMENFNSRRIAINESFYRNNDRLLEGGIWAEVVVAHNDVEDDDYAFYIDNNARKRVGLIGFWDMISFDKVGSVKVKDTNTMEILKDYMANGRFSRGATVIANASLGFIGNIDHSIEQLVNSPQFDLL